MEVNDMGIKALDRWRAYRLDRQVQKQAKAIMDQHPEYREVNIGPNRRQRRAMAKMARFKK